ncbi:hypothetical protein KBA63_01780 [Candidatus Woesebacteria bacterium]|jgi:hypothetical protein|nr:hypothetical protein [Candidatus Woesebacteria bacterium]MBP9687500.1 hypothetical protein [Candidatus Woesebacteria bacterium]
MRFRVKNRLRAVFLLVGIILVFFTLYTVVAPINRIDCFTLDHTCSEPIYSRLQAASLNKPAFLSMRAASTYVSNERRVISSRVIYSFPRKIRVDIITREPSVAIRPMGVNEYTLFDENGRVLDVSDTSDLPTLTIGQIISADQISFVAQLYASLATYFGVEDGEVSTDALKVTIKAMTQPYHFNYPLTGDVDRLLGATRVVLGELNVEHENPTMKTIDFRFKNPVVKKLQ